MTEAEFTEALVHRLALRKGTADGNVFTLNLRHKDFGGQVPRFVRCPDDAGWPEKGRTTSDWDTAADWVRRGYASKIFHELQRANATPGSSKVTFAIAADAYIEYLTKELGSDAKSKIGSRISMLRVHCIPAMGHLLLSAIDTKIVREHAEGLTVSKFISPGIHNQAKAELGTRKNFIRATQAVWNHMFPDDSCSWAGIHLKRDEESKARRQALAEGDFEELLRPKSGALLPADFMKALVGAMHYDHSRASRPTTRASMIPNTAYAIVSQVALGLRISEVRSLQWRHFDFARRVVYIGGSKTTNSFRVVPLQNQLVPWLLELKALQGDNISPKAYVIRTNPRATVTTRGALTTLSTRYAWALKLSGLKRPKKATHWARATHATWGDHSPLIELHHLKVYLGHAAPRGGSTDAYTAQMIELMPEAHREYIQHIPTPDQVRAALNSFEPKELTPWRDRRKVYPRTKVARAEQHARAVPQEARRGKRD